MSAYAPMRTTLLALALILCYAPLHAQLLAGEVPDGSTAYQVGIDLTLSTAFSSDSADVEFDCDDFMDAWARLYRGAPEIDAPHVAMLDFLDEDIEVCMDLTGGFQQRPKYHAFGEALDCSGGFEYMFADELVLGDLGGFTAIGPWTVDSMYIAYRRGGIVGWILLSFDLTGLDIRLQIHELLSICDGTTAIATNEALAPLALFPNPSNGEVLRVESPDAIRALDVFDATGRRVAGYRGMVRTIYGPERPGCYLVQATHADGRRSVTRLVRQ